MTTVPEDKKGANPQKEAVEEEDRPTVTPPFDPSAFAKRATAVGPPPRKGRGSSHDDVPIPQTIRGLMPTLTDPEELEAARRRSIESVPAKSRPTPRGLLSLANMRAPSSPPQVKAWEEQVTSPPPPLSDEVLAAMARSDSPPSGHMPYVPSPPVPPTAQEMNDRVSLGDYTGALEIAEKLLVAEPKNEQVRACADNCRAVLRQMYITRVGPLERVPMVMVARDQLRWLSIDHRAGFVLSLVDGVSSIEMILDVSGMPELDALRILSELAQQRIVSFR